MLPPPPRQARRDASALALACAHACCLPGTVGHIVCMADMRACGSFFRLPPRCRTCSTVSRCEQLACSSSPQEPAWGV
eukprot:6211291-Pleurochrysis_carterae.AAC.3